MDALQQKIKRTEREISKPADFTDPDVLYQKLIDTIREYHPSTVKNILINLGDGEFSDSLPCLADWSSYV